MRLVLKHLKHKRTRSHLYVITMGRPFQHYLTKNSFELCQVSFLKQNAALTRLFFSLKLSHFSPAYFLFRPHRNYNHNAQRTTWHSSYLALHLQRHTVRSTHRRQPLHISGEGLDQSLSFDGWIQHKGLLPLPGVLTLLDYRC